MSAERGQYHYDEATQSDVERIADYGICHSCLYDLHLSIQSPDELS